MADPVELLERRLRAVLEGQQGTQGLHFFCQIGGSYDDLGMVTLQISGSGWTLLSSSHQDEDEELLFNMRLQPEDLRRLFSVLLTHPFWRATPVRRARREGETNIHLRISDQAGGIWNGLQFWDDDVHEFPELGRLLKRLNRLIEALSGGEIETMDFDDVDQQG